MSGHRQSSIAFWATDRLPLMLWLCVQFYAARAPHYHDEKAEKTGRLVNVQFRSGTRLYWILAGLYKLIRSTSLDSRVQFRIASEIPKERPVTTDRTCRPRFSTSAVLLWGGCVVGAFQCYGFSAHSSYTTGFYHSPPAFKTFRIN